MSQSPPDLSTVILDRLASEAALPVNTAIIRFSHAPHSGNPLNISLSTNSPTLFLALNTIDTCYNRWLGLPRPSYSQLSEVRQALSIATSSEPSSYISIELSFLSQTVHLPLYILNLWPWLQSIVAFSHSWEAAWTTLVRLSSSGDSQALASRFLSRLSTLALDLPIPGILYFRSSCLPDLLNNAWISDEHVNAAAQVIAMHPQRTETVAILDTYFLIHLARHVERHGNFSSRSTSGVEERILTHEILELLIPIYTTGHWSLLYINIPQRTYAYTDTLTLGTTIPPLNYLTVVSAWLSHTLGHSVSLSLTPRPFKIDRQTDSHSCGVTLVSTMAHYAIGGVFQSWLQSAAVVHRLIWCILLSMPLDKEQLSGITFDTGDGTDRPSTLSEGHLFNSSADSLSSSPQSPLYSFSDLPTISSGRSTHPPSQFQPTGKKLTQLLLPFPLVPRQDWLALEKKCDLERREEIVDRLSLAEMKKIKKDIKRREYERKRKREQQRRRKEARAALKLEENAIKSDTSSDSEPPCSTPPAPIDPEKQRKLAGFTRNRLSHSANASTTSNGSLPRWKKAHMRPTKRMNWCHPLVWPIIQQAADRVGFPWSPREIVRQLQQIDPTLFATLRPQRISQWRDHTVTDSLRWKESHMQAIQAGAQVNGEEAGRRGIFHNHPQVVQSICSCLLNLCQAGVLLGLNLIRGYMVGMIRHYIPDAFTRTYRNGQPFQCLTEFVRLFLREQLGWSLRKGTRAAQKYPPNVNTVLHDAYLRFACAVRDEDIPSCCIVNADQTQVVYNPGDQKTWTTAGDRQIHIVSSEDKRVFTLMGDFAPEFSGSQLPTLPSTLEKFGASPEMDSGRLTSP